MGKGEDTLIGPFCEGKKAEFSGAPCQYYEPDGSQECRLLKGNDREKFWMQDERGKLNCRANPWEILNRILDANMRKLHNKYPGVVDDREDFDYAVILQRVNKATLRQATLAVWSNYLKLAVRHEVIRRIEARHDIPERHQCGTCKWLSDSSPYFCLKHNEPRKKTDSPCEEGYAVDIPDIVALEVDFEGHHPEDTLEQSLPFEQIVSLLEQRIDAEEAGSKQREKYARQYEGIMLLMQLLEEGFTESEAKRKVIRRYPGEKKMFYRDLQEVREFLQQKMSCFS